MKEANIGSKQFFGSDDASVRGDHDLVQIHEDHIVINLAKSRDAIRECISVLDAKDLMDRFAALKVWAERKTRGIELKNDAEELAIRSERKLGQLLKELQKHSGGRPLKKPVSDEVQVFKLSDLGLTRNASSRAQRIADIEEARFEQAIKDAKDRGKEMTRQVLRLVAVALLRPKKVWSVDGSVSRIRSLVIKETLAASEHEKTAIAKALIAIGRRLVSEGLFAGPQIWPFSAGGVEAMEHQISVNQKHQAMLPPTGIEWTCGDNKDG